MLERMGDFALALIRPDEQLPLLNDSHLNEPLSMRSVFKLAAIAFTGHSSTERSASRSDFAWVGREDNALKEEEPLLRTTILRESGYAVLRPAPTGSQPLRPNKTQTYLLFDAGDLGPHHCPGHGHADALSFELWSYGQPLLVDPGTYQYVEGKWRDYFRSTAAHNTLTVDGQDQSEFGGPFRVGHMAQARLISQMITDELTEVEGEHDGYLRLPTPVMHRRRIRFHGDDYITIVDQLLDPQPIVLQATAHHGGEDEENHSHQLALWLHLPPIPMANVIIRSESSARIAYPGDIELDININNNISSNRDGRIQVEEGWVSDSWYEKRPAPVLVYRMKAKIPSTFTTHLKIVSQ